MNDMISQYQKRKDFLPLIQVEDLSESMLTVGKNRAIDSCLDDRLDLRSVTKEPQRDTTSIDTARAMIDAVVTDCLALDIRLDRDAQFS